MNKQIEEMAKCCRHYDVRMCRNPRSRQLMCNPHGCQDGIVFKKLVEYGYLKSTDVAREIFEELETVLYKIAKPSIRADGILETKIMDGFHIRTEDYNAIRKKYESEGADDEILDD